jgi:type IV pilus assembly protein PilP
MSVLINIHKWSIVALLTAVLSACGGADTSDLVSFVENAHRESKPEIDPLPEIRLYENFVYSATDLPDPFATLNLLPGSDGTAVGGVSPDTNRRKEPLEKFALGDLSLVGTLQRNDQPWVIIKAPDGTVHRITTGNYAGTNYGRVVSILDSRVELKELVLGTGNRWVERGAFLAFGATGSQQE